MSNTIAMKLIICLRILFRNDVYEPLGIMISAPNQPAARFTEKSAIIELISFRFI